MKLTFLNKMQEIDSCYCFYLPISGAYSTEPMCNFWWCIFTTGVLFIYHFIPLQGLGLVSIFYTVCHLFQQNLVKSLKFHFGHAVGAYK